MAQDERRRAGSNGRQEENNQSLMENMKLERVGGLLVGGGVGMGKSRLECRGGGGWGETLNCRRMVVAEETLGAARKHFNPSTGSKQQQEAAAGQQVCSI